MAEVAEQEATVEAPELLRQVKEFVELLRETADALESGRDFSVALISGGTDGQNALLVRRCDTVEFIGMLDIAKSELIKKARSVSDRNSVLESLIQAIKERD